jgi:RNA polymerase sigma-70 factor, ECF subfamily
VSSQRTNDEFVRRFVRHQQDLYAYIFTLVPHTADAQDILQETAVALWAKVDDYNLEEPFMPWAARFAWFQIRKHRLYQARRHRHVVALSDEAVAALAADQAEFEAGVPQRGQILQECMEKLIGDDRLLLRDRYDLKISIRDVAQQRGVEPGQLYKRLGRIRHTLLDCINNTLSAADKGAGPIRQGNDAETASHKANPSPVLPNQPE